MASVTGLTIDDIEKLPDALALNHELVLAEQEYDFQGDAHGPDVSYLAVRRRVYTTASCEFSASCLNWPSRLFRRTTNSKP